MALVAYSDSEGSDDESRPKSTSEPQSKPQTKQFAVSKDNPKKIRVTLPEAQPLPSDREDGEPVAKRPRIGGGAFSGFNAMLPAPKRDDATSKPTTGSKATARKVFSLKTGAEPAFSRESDAELRQLFTEQNDPEEPSSTIPEIIPKRPASDAAQTTVGKPLMFKPLSVSRGLKKKNPITGITLSSTTVTAQPLSAQHRPTDTALDTAAQPKKKINLFSADTDDTVEASHDLYANEQRLEEEEDEIIEVLPEEDDTPIIGQPSTNQPETLDSLATTLNLSAAERRQLLGRNGQASSKVINFNTDTEYAMNQAHVAAGEQVQHNPVRAIAPGKHSLKQLIGSAQGQKDALEESFAAGRRNKKEAGSKYGW